LKDYSKNGIHKIAGQDFYCEEYAIIAQKVASIIPENLRHFSSIVVQKVLKMQ
jgi:4-aminobutyrate aminotransferase